jgi:hypothetical protein
MAEPRRQAASRWGFLFSLVPSPGRGGGSVRTASGPGGSSAKHSFQAPRFLSRAHSSAGERPLHTREVPGSIPGAPISDLRKQTSLSLRALGPLWRTTNDSAPPVRGLHAWLEPLTAVRRRWSALSRRPRDPPLLEHLRNLSQRATIRMTTRGRAWRPLNTAQPISSGQTRLSASRRRCSRRAILILVGFPLVLFAQVVALAVI